MALISKLKMTLAGRVVLSPQKRWATPYHCGSRIYGVKEQYLDKYGEAFANAGFAVLIYDTRNFG